MKLRAALMIAGAVAISSPAASSNGAQTTATAQESRSEQRDFPWDLLGLLGLAGLLGLRRNDDHRTDTTRR